MKNRLSTLAIALSGTLLSANALATEIEWIAGKTKVTNGDTVSYLGECYTAQHNPGTWETPSTASSWFWTTTACSDQTPPPTCIEGQELIEGSCIDIIEPPICNETQELVNGECMAIVVPPICSETQELVNGECMAIVVPPICNESQELIDGSCVDKTISPITDATPWIAGKTEVSNGEIVAYNRSCFEAKNNPGTWETPKSNSWFWTEITCPTIAPELPIVCPDGTTAPTLAECPPEVIEPVTCPDGSSVTTLLDCPVTEPIQDASELANQALTNIIPNSGMNISGQSEYQTSQDYQPQAHVWAEGLNEEQVFHRQISHQGDQPWTLRIGKGGQIYSMQTQFGEIVPPQDHHDAQWIDEVWHTVAVDQSQHSREKKYFIHQAGVYLRDDSLQETFYSPLIAESINTEQRSYSVINWGQQAHIPTDFTSGAIYYTQYLDLGDGVIEVNAGVYNSGVDTLDFFNFPWGGVRRSTLEYDIRSNVDGSYYQYNESFALAKVDVYNKTAGWSGFSAAKDGNDNALVLVFGHDKKPLPTWQKGASSLRTGYAGNILADQAPTNVSDTQWRNYLVSSARRRFDLQPGLGVWVRYYYVIGDSIELAKEKIIARDLVDYATYSLMDHSEQQSARIAWYKDTTSPQVFTDQKIKDSNVSPEFYTFAQPINGSKALFMMLSAGGEVSISTNPYRFAQQNKPYDGNTQSWKLMGYVLPQNAASKTIQYDDLKSIVGEYLSADEVLLVPSVK